jgi:flagellar biosynthetic protein FlhB
VTEERTEKATPRKLKESRKEGRVARTPEIGAWSALLVIAAALHWLATKGLESLRTLLTQVLGMTEHPGTDAALGLLHHAGVLALVMSVCVGLAVVVVGVAAATAQGGFFVATKALKPQWSRLNPLQGAKRLFGPHALWEGAKMLAKSALVAVFVWRGVKALMPIVGGLVPIPAALDLASAAALGLMRDVALAGLLFAAADYAVQRRRIGKQVKMTKKEVRDEHRQTEGDPHVRSALRGRMLAAARSRMMAAVPKADVVVVNPTHVAVALRYEPERGSPRVVAKGAGAVAARIREVAEEARVTMVEDVPLARALHASCEVGQAIPPELYQAVAQVLAFVYGRRAKGTAAGRHPSPRRTGPLPTPARRRRRTPNSSGARPPGR